MYCAIYYSGVYSLMTLCSYYRENECIYCHVEFNRQKRWLAITLRRGIGSGNSRLSERERKTQMEEKKRKEKKKRDKIRSRWIKMSEKNLLGPFVYSLSMCTGLSKKVKRCVTAVRRVTFEDHGPSRHLKVSGCCTGIQRYALGDTHFLS